MTIIDNLKDLLDLRDVDDLSDHLQNNPADVIKLRMMFQHNPDQMMNMLVGGADSIIDHIQQAERVVQRKQSAEALADLFLSGDNALTSSQKELAQEMSASFAKFVEEQKANLQ